MTQTRSYGRTAASTDSSSTPVTAAGIGSSVLWYNRFADHNIFILSPDPTSMTDAYALIKVLHQRDAEARIHVVVNRVRAPGQGRKVFERLQGVCRRFLDKDLDYLGSLEDDDAVPGSIGARRPFVVGNPRSPVAGSLRRIKDRLLAGGGPTDLESGGRRREGYGDRLTRVLQE